MYVPRLVATADGGGAGVVCTVILLGPWTVKEGPFRPATGECGVCGLLLVCGGEIGNLDAGAAAPGGGLSVRLLSRRLGGSDGYIFWSCGRQRM